MHDKRLSFNITLSPCLLSHTQALFLFTPSLSPHTHAQAHNLPFHPLRTRARMVGAAGEPYAGVDADAAETLFERSVRANTVPVVVEPWASWPARCCLPR